MVGRCRRPVRNRRVSPQSRWAAAPAVGERQVELAGAVLTS